MVGCTGASSNTFHIWRSEDVSFQILKCGGIRRLHEAPKRTSSSKTVGTMQDFILAQTSIRRCLFFETMPLFKCFSTLMSHFFDIHTHFPTGDPALVEMENLRFGQSASGRARFCSAGLHPWFLEKVHLEAALQWLEVQAALPATRAIGEAGLDKVCGTDWALQEQAFRACIERSERVGKPLLIHCVKAYNEVIQLKKQLNPAQNWIFHGFNKHPDTAAMLLRAGCFLSFGNAILQEGNHSAEALQRMPDDRFFLETDDAEEVGIVRIYEQAALLRGVDVECLKRQVAENVQAVFKF